MERYTKYRNILFVILIINILLVATHEGEFWPFSIFPMFSQAGNPWSRGVVQQIDSPDAPDLWETKPLSEIRNRVLSLDSINVDAIDYANFVSKTETWNTRRIQGLRDLLQIEDYPGSMWMATQVRGYLTENDSVVVEAVPLLLFSPDTTYLNPDLITD